MTAREKRDGDQPIGSGLLGKLHLRMGRMAIAASARLRGPVTLGVRLLAFDDQNRVFLVRHSYIPGLHLPGGGVEPGESCREAAVREAREEGALEMPSAPELFHIYWNKALGRRDHVALFVARGGARQTRTGAKSLEIVSAGFYPLDQLPADVTPATRARIGEVLHGEDLSETW